MRGCRAFSQRFANGGRSDGGSGMRQVCSIVDGSNAPAVTMLKLVDCEVRGAVEQTYGLLTGTGSPFNTALTISLTLYVALMGFQLMLGRTQLRMSDLTTRLIAIGVVLALAMNWPTYQRLVYEVLTNGPTEAARWASGSTGVQSQLEAIDAKSSALINVADAWTRAEPKLPANNPGNSGDLSADTGEIDDLAAMPASSRVNTPMAAEGLTGPRLLTWSAVLLLVITVGPLLITKIVLGILLGIGPLFILLALFGPTRGLSSGWLRASAFLALVPILSALTTASALLLLGPMVSRIVDDAAMDRFSTAQALGLFAGTLVLGGAGLLLMRVSQMIASGWIIEIGRAADEQSPNSSPRSDGTAQTDLGAMPRAEQITYAIERATAAAQATSEVAAPAAFRIDMPRSGTMGAITEAAPSRRMNLSGPAGGERSAIRPFRAREAR